jgi:hypothetical protein
MIIVVLKVRDNTEELEDRCELDNTEELEDRCEFLVVDCLLRPP